MSKSARLFSVSCFALAAGAALRWQALFTPLFNDDYQQLAMLRGAFVLKRAAWNLFWFSGRNPAEWRRLVDFGFDPWWTAPDHRLSMLRPLSSLLIAFDADVLGADPWRAHLHSLAWWAALVCAASCFFARVLPARVAAIAIVLFALDQAHNVPLAWLANRSTLVSGTFAVFALYAHVRARSAELAPSSRRWFGFESAAWALALLSGEYALGMLAYLVAFELLARHEGRALRLRALVPAGILATAYLGLRSALGIGIRASGFYVTPDEPLRFLAQAAKFAPVGASDVLLGVPADFYRTNVPWRSWVLGLGLFDYETWKRVPEWQSVQIVLGVLAIAAAIVALRVLERRHGARLPALRFLVLGSGIALVIASGATPSARLLVAPELGASALLASILDEALRARATAARASLAWCLALAGVHLALPARDAYVDARTSREHAERARDFALSAEIPEHASELDLVIVSASDFTTAAHLPWVRYWHGHGLPHSYRRLSGAFEAHDVRRLDDHSLELSVLGSDVRDTLAGSLYRPREQPFAPGQRICVPGMTVEILATDAGNPYRLRVRFDRALDDPRLVFLHAFPEGIRRIALPAQGETLRLPFAALPYAN